MSVTEKSPPSHIKKIIRWIQVEMKEADVSYNDPASIECSELISNLDSKLSSERKPTFNSMYNNANKAMKDWEEKHEPNQRNSPSPITTDYKLAGAAKTHKSLSSIWN